MTLEERQQELINEFAMFDDWMQKYEYIIELGKDLPVIDETYKNDDHLIKGCQSRVWLHAERNADETISFKADSDAIITKGLISMMIRVMNNLPADVIANADLHFVQDIGLTQHLSPTRSNGLASMIKQMKIYALVGNKL
ncbi:MAG: SufE family protein [Flavobacteriales bacterium]|jgi:cysteine desulfuration protein SufE